MVRIHLPQTLLGCFLGRTAPIGKASFFCSMSWSLFRSMVSWFPRFCAPRGMRETRCFLQDTCHAQLELQGLSQASFIPGIPVFTNLKSIISQLAKSAQTVSFSKVTMCRRSANTAIRPMSPLLGRSSYFTPVVGLVALSSSAHCKPVQKNCQTTCGPYWPF